MPKELYINAQRATLSYLHLHARGVTDHMIYGPLSDRYWAESVRIVAINSETWGYQGCGVVRVIERDLKRWFEDSRKTVIGTLALTSVVLDRIMSGRAASPEVFRAAYRDRRLLAETLERMTYYNFRSDSNPRIAQNYAAIASVGQTELGRLVWHEILALDPHIVLVSGRSGLDAINALLGLETPIRFRDYFVHPSGFIIHSIAHPSRPAYTQWTAAVEAIAAWKEESPKTGKSEVPG